VGLWSSRWQPRRKKARRPRSSLANPPPKEISDEKPTEEPAVRFHQEIKSRRNAGGEAWIPPQNPDPSIRRQIGVRLMRSTAWFPKSTTKVALRGLPYILPSGEITGSALYSWRSNSAQWFSTLCRAVWKRLSKRSNKKSRRNRLSKDVVARISVYYCITQNNSNLERLWHCDAKRVRGLLHYLISIMDDQKRFLYDQMCQSILWLQSRGKPRAQSISKFIIPDYRGFWTFDTIRDISICLNALCDPWIARRNQTVNTWE